MARIRTIKPQFFKNEELADLSAFTRLLFIGLWLLADVEGKLEDRPKRIKAEIFPYDDLDIDKSLSQLQDAGFINRYDAGEVRVLKIINFEKHQRITGSEAETSSIYPDYGQETHRNHFGNILETPRTTGKERKGREGNKEGNKEGKGGARDHLFSDSEIFSKEIFQEKLQGTQYETANVDYYHEVISNWSESKGAMKKNWLSAAKNWMANDMKDGKFITKNFKPPENGNSKKSGSKGESAQSAFSKIDSMPG